MNDSQLQRPSWADKETLNVVRPEVRKILEWSAAFQTLPFDVRKKLASDLVKVGAYLASPEGVRATELEPPQKPLARAQEDGVEDPKARLSKAPGFAGKDFQGGAIRQGTEQFGELVKKVHFPMFVSGLIQNVFHAIVDSSMYDKSQLSNTTSVSTKYGGWFSPVRANVNSTTSYDHVATRVGGLELNMARI